MNACGHHHVGHIGILGVDKKGAEYYQISLGGDLPHFALIAIHFPTFTDGRGYSYARLLRDHYRYAGELRALGDIGLDQIYFLGRCGFDSLVLPESLDPDSALAAFDDFTAPYQGASDDPQPLFRRHQRR
jgi:uncharacterized protein (DUF934 family)